MPEIIGQIASFDGLVSLLTLTAMEVVLGIDNIVFISLLVGKLPPGRQGKARRLGLFLAMFLRIGLLLAISWVMGLTAPFFALLGHAFSGRDLILLAGGAFLVAKATHEIYDKVEVPHEDVSAKAGTASFVLTILQILLLDIVFSLDSVITAVGMASHVSVMITAVVIAVGIMMVFSAPVGDFVNRHPSMKILALSFLLLIGVMLAADGLGQHVSKGYIYSAMTFSLFVEVLNMRYRRKESLVAAPVAGEAAAPAAPPADPSAGEAAAR